MSVEATTRRVLSTVCVASLSGRAIATTPVYSPSDLIGRARTRHCCPSRLESAVKNSCLMASSRESLPRTGVPYSAAVSSEIILPDVPSRYWAST